MPKPSSNLFRCEPERLDLPLSGDQETALLSPRTQLLQGGLVQGWPTILIILEDETHLTSSRVYAHELRAALDVLEPAKEKPKRVRTRTKTVSAAAQRIMDRVLTGKDEHRGD